MRIPRLLAFVVPPLLAVAPLRSQVPVSGELRTVAPYGNFARDGASLDFKSWPASTLLPASTTSTIGALAGNAFADTLVSWNVWPGDILTCDVSEQGGGSVASLPISAGTTSSASAATLQQGVHELRLVIRGTPGLRGKVEAWASGVARTGSSVTMALDVGDDASLDFSVAIAGGEGFDRRQWDRNLDASGSLRVRIVTDARCALASGDTLYKTGISVRFTPGAFCEIGSYGSACGGWLVGFDDLVGSGRRVSLQLNGAAPGASAVLVLGLRQVLLPLPGTTCLLLAEPLVLLPFTTDAYGGAQQALVAPLGPLVADAQHVVLAGGQLTSSNGVAIVCR
jgi:hypothetical protein